MAAGFTEADCNHLEQAEELLADRELASRVLPVEKAFAPLYRGGFERKTGEDVPKRGEAGLEKTRCSHVEGTSRSTGQGGIFWGSPPLTGETGLLEPRVYLRWHS